MSSNPSEFARRVLEAFTAAGHATDEEVGDAGGPSTTTMAKYRKVANGEMTMTEPRGDVLRRIDRAAGWKSGSARALWRQGTEPEPPTPSALEALATEKPGRVVTAGGGMEGYVEWLGERLTEVEERLDLLTAMLAEPGLPEDSDVYDRVLALVDEAGKRMTPEVVERVRQAEIRRAARKNPDRPRRGPREQQPD